MMCMNKVVPSDLKQEKTALLAFADFKGVGYWALYRYRSAGNSLRDLLSLQTQEQVEQALKVKISAKFDNWQNCVDDAIDKANKLISQFDSSNIKLIFNGEEGFPESLQAIQEAPQWIFVQGNIELLYKNSVAIVGTRKPSGDGIFLTKYVVATLANLEFPTISGLAHGIDQLVHEESLRYKIPTIAVLGTGLLSNYPSGSERLRASIVQSGGAILTEYLPHQGYSSENFIRRNRLQAALSRLLIPVEWKIKSGTAHTVSYAHKYGKKILNVYLSGTYENRPELSFSEKAYQATSYLAPNDKTLVVEVVRVVSAPKIQPHSQTLLGI